MKSFEQFLEATIVPPKDAKRAADNVASSDKMAQKLTQIQQRRQNERIKQGKVSAPAQTRAMKPLTGSKAPERKALPPSKKGGDLVPSKGSSLATKAADKGSALVNSNNKQQRETQRVRSGSAGEGKATYRGRYGSGNGAERKRRSMEKLKKSTEGKGFVGGLKSSLGGDVLSKNRSERSKSREELGRKTGRTIRSAPGKAVGLAGKALKAASQVKMVNRGIESGESQSGSYETKDTKI